MPKRLDQYLVHHGLVETRTKAQRRITAGEVFVDGVAVTKVSTPVPEGSLVTVADSRQYVSRGALKLEAALEQWGISVADLRVLDVGASTGGFTEVLLSRDARHVVALDVGHDQLHPDLRADPRVTVFEGVNARDLTAKWWQQHDGAEIDLVVVDVSFISLEHIIPPVVSAVGLCPWVCLVKPQFEVGRGNVVGGIARNREDHEVVLHRVIDIGRHQSLHLAGLAVSPITGESGNREYLCWFEPTPRRNPTQWSQVIRELVHS
jgi:23S rRNA (cytidine1920-2'-O)/16S rRNA (cytidine1409-2'-O)-methyltransferase